MNIFELFGAIDYVYFKGKNIPNITEITKDENQDLRDKVLVLTENKLKKVNVEKLKSCALVLSEKYVEEDINLFVPRNFRKCYAKVSKKLYQDYSDKIKFIFITGTNGKTSSVSFVWELYKRLGEEVGKIGTFGAIYKDLHIKTNMTTPDPEIFHKICKEFYERGCRVIVAEASAHALYYQKLYGVKAEVGAFTNIGRDHLDFFDENSYICAKQTLFREEISKNAVINVDDSVGREISKSRECITFGKSNKCDLQILDVRDSEKLSFSIIYKGEKYDLNTRLFGEFNAYNITNAIACLIAMGKPISQIVNVVDELSCVKGRMQEINNDKGLRIFVDYAHTPDGLKNVLKSAKCFTQNNLWVVFGCGGNRDSGKRFQMGEIAGKFSDKVVITSDNPRHESPDGIAKEVLLGVEIKEKATVILDRYNAISYAINNAQFGDTVIVAGKGEEDYMEIDGKFYPFKDEDTIIKVLTEK